MPRLSRRDLFALGPAALAVGAAAACRDGATPTDPTDPTDTDTDTEGPPWCGVEPGTEADGWVPVSLLDHPALGEVGGSAQVRLADRLVNIAHVEEGCFVAMGTVCTHEGCAVEVRSGAVTRFVCPCHGALYGWDGAPIAGPAPDPLPTWPAGLRDGAVWVRISD